MILIGSKAKNYGSVFVKSEIIPHFFRIVREKAK